MVVAGRDDESVRGLGHRVELTPSRACGVRLHSHAMRVIWAYAHNTKAAGYRRPAPEGGDMPGRDGTGPMGHGPMTDGRRGFCGDATAFPGRGDGRGRRSQFYATGLTGWQRARADDRATAPTGDAPDPFSRVDEKLSQVLQRLDRLESATRD